VRKICGKCKGAGCGCRECGDLGFRGRVVVSETLVIDDELRKYIMSRTPMNEISRYAKSKGMRTMYEDGMEKVEQCITTQDEILRILHE
jgi:type II secretory ATPase GspE/PulE/Tfp pilus assembly ATPase PilB-like protein